MTAKDPQFLINPNADDSSWTPEPYQIICWPNPSRANSLWIGTVAQLVMLPGRLWTEVVRPLLRGRPLMALMCLLWFLPVSSLIWLWWGIRGDAYALKVDLQLMLRARVMTTDESLIAMALGLDEVAVPMGALTRPE